MGSTTNMFIITMALNVLILGETKEGQAKVAFVICKTLGHRVEYINFVFDEQIEETITLLKGDEESNNNR